MIALCFAAPVLAGFALAWLFPATYTARSLLLVGEAPEPGMAMQTMVPELPGLRMISPDRVQDVLSRSGPLRVVMVGLQDATATQAASQLATVLSGYSATAQEAAHRVVQTAADSADTERSLSRWQQQAGTSDWDAASRDAGRRVADLARQYDDAEQQAAAARAGSKAALGLLADQPDNVLEFREAAAPAADPARTMLLGLLVERDHLLAQYSPGFPAVREINDKIATVRASIAADARSPRLTVRETRNPAVERLRSQAGAASVKAQEAEARLGVIGHQLAGARAHAALIDAGQPKVHALQQARLALDAASRQQRVALESLPPLVQLGSPVIEAVDHSAGYVAELAGLVLGLVSAAAAALLPRFSIFQLSRQPALPRRTEDEAASLVSGTRAPATLPAPFWTATRLIRAPEHGIVP